VYKDQGPTAGSCNGIYLKSKFLATMKTSFLLILTAALGLGIGPASAFEGRINATLTRGGQTQTFCYTVGKNSLRIERGETDWPHARNIFNLQTGDLTLLFPHNRSYVHLKASNPNSAPQVPGLPLPPGGLPPGVGPQPPAVTAAPNVPGLPARPNMPALPPGIGPQTGATPGAPPMPGMPARPMPPGGLPPGVGPQIGAPPGAPAMPGMPDMGAMPMMPMPGMDGLDLRATGEKTNLLGYPCLRYELTQRDEVMEIWATDQLLPFQPYLQSQPLSLAPRMVAEQWGDLLKARKLFPLLATLKTVNGPERLHYQVKTITPEKITDPDGQLFQPPADYHQLDPLPF